MAEELNLHELVKRVVGPIRPVGETNTDNKRFENLKTMTALVDKLLTDIDKVAEDKDRVEYSMKRAGTFASDFFDQIGIVE